MTQITFTILDNNPLQQILNIHFVNKNNVDSFFSVYIINFHIPVLMESKMFAEMNLQVHRFSGFW